MSWHRTRTVVRRHAYVLWRAPHRWFDIAFWPLMDVILWGSLGTYVARQDVRSGAGTVYLLAGIAALPGVFQPVARVLPSTHAFNALRAVLAGGPLPWAEIRSGLIGAVAVVALCFAFTARMLRAFRRRGLVTRFS